MIRRAGDRRTFCRLDVIGELDVVLTRTEDAILRNVGLNGALIETTILTSQLRHEVTVRLDPSMPKLRAAVRHVSQLERTPADGGPRCHVGLEFLALSATDVELLRRFIRRFPRAGPGFQI